MNINITFREYTSPTVDEKTGESVRGEFISEYKKKFQGADVVDINRQVNHYLEICQGDEIDVQTVVWHGQ